MKIYLDIDGTLIHEEATDNYGKPAEGLAEFIISLQSYETYWLTTHCTTGDPLQAREILKAVLPSELHSEIDRIKPTVWQDLKTEAIDFNSDFIWFDNDIYTSESKVLERCRENQGVIEVDLKTNPKQLIEITREIFT